MAGAEDHLPSDETLRCASSAHGENVTEKVGGLAHNRKLDRPSVNVDIGPHPAVLSKVEDCKELLATVIHVTRPIRRAWLFPLELAPLRKCTPLQIVPTELARSDLLPILPVLGDAVLSLYMGVSKPIEQIAAFRHRWKPGKSEHYGPDGQLEISDVMDVPFPFPSRTSPHPHLHVAGAEGDTLQPAVSSAVKHIGKVARGLAPADALVISFEWEGSRSPFKHLWRNLTDKYSGGLWIAMPFSFLGLILEKASIEGIRCTIVTELPPASIAGWPFMEASVTPDGAHWCAQVDLRMAARPVGKFPILRDSMGKCWRLSSEEYRKELLSVHLDTMQYFGFRFAAEPVCPDCVRSYPPGALSRIKKLAETAADAKQLLPLRLAKRLWAHPNRIAVQHILDMAQNGANLCYDGPRIPARACTNSRSFLRRPAEAAALLKKLLRKGVTSQYVTDFEPGLLHVNPLALVPKPPSWRLVRDNSALASSVWGPHGPGAVAEFFDGQLTIPSLNSGEARMVSPLDGVARMVRKLRTLISENPLRKLKLVVADVGGAFYSVRVRDEDLALNGIQVDFDPACDDPLRDRCHRWAIMVKCDMGSRASVTKWGVFSYTFIETLNVEYPFRFSSYVDDYSAILLESQGKSALDTIVREAEDVGLEMPARKRQLTDKGTVIGVVIDLTRSSQGVVTLRSRPDKDKELLNLIPLDSRLGARRWAPSLQLVRQIYMSLQWRAQFWFPMAPILSVWLELLRFLDRQVRGSRKFTEESAITIQGKGSRVDIVQGKSPFHLAARIRAAACWLHRELPRWKGSDLVTFTSPRGELSLSVDTGRDGTAWITRSASGRSSTFENCWGAASFRADTWKLFIPKDGERESSTGMEWFGLWIALLRLTSRGCRRTKINVDTDSKALTLGAARYAGLVSLSAFIMGEVLGICSKYNLDLCIRHVLRSDRYIEICDKAGRGDKKTMAYMNRRMNNCTPPNLIAECLVLVSQVRNGVLQGH